MERLLKFIKGAAEQGWKTSWITQETAPPPPANIPQESPSAGDEMCPIHNVKMFPKKGQYGPFWSHGNQLEDGSWQNGSGKGYR